jgi:tRNA uridine 5-carboxymethylaminomethyl modification enzyme
VLFRSRLSLFGAELGVVGKERFASAEKRIESMRLALDAFESLRLSPREWRTVGAMRAIPNARHGRSLSCAELLAVSGVDPFDLVDAAARVVARREAESDDWSSDFAEDDFAERTRVLLSVADADGSALESAAAECFYRPYLERQRREISELRSEENASLPIGLDYSKIGGLRDEDVETLQRHRPETLGEAGRLSGVTPSARLALMRYAKRHARDARRE